VTPGKAHSQLIDPMTEERILLVTGRLAEPALRSLVDSLAERTGLRAEIAVLGISVAALMNVEFVRRRLTVPPGFERVVLPGWCQGDLASLDLQFGLPFERGPKDFHDLQEHLGRGKNAVPELSRHDIEILAEINHAPRLSDAEIVGRAERYRADGADVIDLGCIPGESWARAGDVTRLLRREGFRVSIDSFDRNEVETAVGGGAELVLSCNASNRAWAASLPAELVAIPDDPRDFSSLDETVDVLIDRRARFRIDPILEPIGFGFAASLGRYLSARRKWPEQRILMGIGNVTELTEVDSAGINLLLAGFCQELRIESVLTTEVINWCRSAVREFDIARRVAFHAVTRQVLPKHMGSGLVMLRDTRVTERGVEELSEMARRIKDPNFRIFAEQGEIHLLNRDGYWHGADPFELFDRLGPLESAHAFYLGYELAKAATALALGKNYVQDEALTWGFLTRPEVSALHRSSREVKSEDASPEA
jgi:dihydropteroate synthase-like protein